MAPRRPHGSAVDPISVTYRIERQARDRLAALAAHAGSSAAVYLERLIANVELDERGVPVWWPEQTELADGELPIDSR